MAIGVEPPTRIYKMLIADAQQASLFAAKSLRRHSILRFNVRGELIAFEQGSAEERPGDRWTERVLAAIVAVDSGSGWYRTHPGKTATAPQCER